MALDSERKVCVCVGGGLPLDLQIGEELKIIISWKEEEARQKAERFIRAVWGCAGAGEGGRRVWHAVST